jgi:hypothetical protein
LTRANISDRIKISIKKDMPSYLDERAFTMIKKSLFYSIILLACFSAHDALPVAANYDNTFMLIPLAVVTPIGAFIGASKIGNFLQPIGATLGTKACQSLGTLIVKGGNALIDNSSTIGNATSTIGSYAIGGTIGFAACFFGIRELFKQYKEYKIKKMRQEEKNQRNINKKVVNDSRKSYPVD